MIIQLDIVYAHNVASTVFLLYTGNERFHLPEMKKKYSLQSYKRSIWPLKSFFYYKSLKLSKEPKEDTL